MAGGQQAVRTLALQRSRHGMEGRRGGGDPAGREGATSQFPTRIHKGHSLGSHLIAKRVIEGQMAIWPWKQAMAAETGYGRRNPFGREKKRENGTI